MNAGPIKIVVLELMENAKIWMWFIIHDESAIVNLDGSDLGANRVSVLEILGPLY